MRRALVTGASGFLGSYLIRALAGTCDVVGTYAHRAPEASGNFCRLDLGHPEEVETILDELRPEALVHAAAAADLDWCEREPERATAINVEGTRILARWAAAHGCRFLYISTDQVFSGERGLYRESDPASPICHYGHTKQQAETIVRAWVPDSIVLRVALMFGWSTSRHRSASNAIYENLTRGQPVRLFTDQYRSPILVDWVAEVVARLLRLPEASGLWHLGGDQRWSRYEFGLKLAASFGLDPSGLLPIRMAEFSSLAPRGKDCSLDSTRICRLLGRTRFSAEEGLNRLARTSPPRVE
ncbi:MAG: SDR family oxidoreductase [Acidobacteria bacterium]|nr:SDR family oxidoreductase [Acidobacteriota bacterium]